jgi:hypothetical protein
MDVTEAEWELESTRQECEEILARVSRARHGDFNATLEHPLPTPHVFTTIPSPAQRSDTSHTRILNDQPIADAARAPLNTPITNKHIPPANQGPPTLSGFRRSRSLDSALKQRSPPMAQADSQRDTHPDQGVEDDLSDEFLNHLVQRHADLCRKRQILQGEIEGRLESNKRLATEKLDCATVQLENIRRKEVAELTNASGRDTRIHLPTEAPEEPQLGLSLGLTSGKAQASSLSPDAPPPVSPTGAPTVAAPVPANTFFKGAKATTVVGSALLPPPSSPRTVAIDRLKDRLSELLRTPAFTPPKPPPKFQPTPGATVNTPQQNGRYLTRRANNPHSSNFSGGPTNSNGTHGLPSIQPGVRGGLQVPPPHTPQRPMRPPPYMPGTPTGMPSGVFVGAPHAASQTPQYVPGPVPHGLAAPGMPPPMMQGPGNQPYYVIHTCGKPVHYSPTFLGEQHLLLRQ